MKIQWESLIVRLGSNTPIVQRNQTKQESWYKYQSRSIWQSSVNITCEWKTMVRVCDKNAPLTQSFSFGFFDLHQGVVISITVNPFYEKVKLVWFFLGPNLDSSIWGWLWHQPLSQSDFDPRRIWLALPCEKMETIKLRPNFWESVRRDYGVISTLKWGEKPIYTLRISFYVKKSHEYLRD